MTADGSSDSGLPRPYRGQLEAHERIATGASQPTAGNEPTLAPGHLLGPYRIEAALGSGGMGQVYRAVHRDTGARVALKVARATAAGGVLRQRLENEASVLHKLGQQRSSSHILRFIDAGEADGVFFLATELLEGDDLLGWARRKLHSSKEILEVAAGMAEALATCHGLDIVHRDLTPSNVLVCEGRGAVLVDFGLGRDDDLPNQGLTHTGQVPGKYAYLPPEAVRGATPDISWDLYAFGGCLYAMRTGQEYDPRLQHDLYPSLGAVDDPVTRKLKLIARKCLARQPEHRFASSTELRESLEQAGHPPPAWRGRLLAGIAVAMIALLFALSLLGGTDAAGAPDLFWSHIVHLGMLSLFLARSIWVSRRARPRLELSRFMPWVWLSFLLYYVFNAWRDTYTGDVWWLGVADATISNLTGCCLMLAACALWLPTRSAAPRFRTARLAIWTTWVGLLVLALWGATGDAERSLLLVSLPSALFVGFGLGVLALGLGQKSLQAPLPWVAVVLLYALLQVVYPAFAWIEQFDVGLLIAVYGTGMVGKLALFLCVESTVRSWSLFGYEGQLSDEW